MHGFPICLPWLSLPFLAGMSSPFSWAHPPGFREPSGRDASFVFPVGVSEASLCKWLPLAMWTHSCFSPPPPEAEIVCIATNRTYFLIANRSVLFNDGSGIKFRTVVTRSSLPKASPVAQSFITSTLSQASYTLTTVSALDLQYA